MTAATGPAAPAPDFADPPQECDLVMKGGITSGVVYPRAVIELARRTYRFRSIGGTSAGAIAAAVTAAAEYGRASGGFQKLDLVVRQLGERGFLANLFQPTPELRPLLNVFLDYLEAERTGAAPEDAGGPVMRWLLERIPAQQRPAAKRVVGLVLRHAARSASAGARDGQARGIQIGAAAGGGVALLTALIALVVSVAAGVQISLGLAVGLLAAVVALAAIGALAGSLVGSDIGAAARVGGEALRLTRSRIPANQYGMCSGLSVDGHAGGAAIKDSTGAYIGLTDWLSDTIDHLAGLEMKRTPLTFGALRYHKLADGRDAGIALRMVTTNLSQQQPHVVPFESDLFLFSEQEMARLFPAHVVRHLVQHARRSERLERTFAGEHGPPDAEGQRDWFIRYDDGVESHRLRFLPRADDLPVVVGMRMSISFPVLLSAVPLWAISGAAYAEQDDLQEAASAMRGAAGAGPLAKALAEAPLKLQPRHLQRNWFSDGGICSNFPIHFFDRWFPPRPTFGINLDELPEQVRPHTPKVLDYVDGKPEIQQEDRARRAKYTGDVYMPRSYPRDWLGARWARIDGDLPKFLRAIFDTSLNYRDTMQALLPSYADRIVTIRLTKREGGLNLNMDPETIAAITEKGTRAGREILAQFDMRHHQWVRLRLLLNELEEQLVDLRASIRLQIPAEDWSAIEEQLDDVLRALDLEHMPPERQRANNVVQQLIQDELTAEERFPYPRTRPLTRRESLRLNLLLALIELWGREEGEVFRRDGPRTNRLNLRITPDL